ncbi:MAG: hypothetical protein K6A33_08970 [Clostridiales bacterium]|nr:hypothetical protein [Clostridiales bacterium]
MLVKLFRHDFRAHSRMQIPVLIAISAAAVLGFFNMLFLAGTGSGQLISEESDGYVLMLGAAISGTFLIFLALGIAMAVMSVLIFVRFYRSMVTDEAYLTFTLPVTAGQLIGAKFLASAVWFLIGSAALAIAGGLIYTGAILAGGGDFREAMVDLWQEVFELLAENPLTAFLLILCAVAAAVRWYFQITGAILFGASVVRKNKALAAVGMIFAVNFLVNLITSIFPTLGIFGFGVLFTGMVEFYDFNLNTWLLVQTGISVILAAVFWWLSVRIAKKSVNIE